MRNPTKLRGLLRLKCHVISNVKLDDEDTAVGDVYHRTPNSVRRVALLYSLRDVERHGPTLWVGLSAVKAH